MEPSRQVWKSKGTNDSVEVSRSQEQGREGSGVVPR